MVKILKNNSNHMCKQLKTLPVTINLYVLTQINMFNNYFDY